MDRYGSESAALVRAVPRSRRRAAAIGPVADEAGPVEAARPDVLPAGPRRRRLLVQFAIIAVVIRIALLPLGHPWDTTTFYNMFIDLGHGRSPYDTMRYLNAVASSAQWGVNGAYEGFAYPPGVIYLYWPLARLFVLLHPSLTNHYTVEGLFSMPTIPLDFYLWMKLPVWLADLGIAFLLWRMTKSARSFRDYLLNPYVLFISGCWTFDAVMAFGLLLAIYWMERARPWYSGLALAVGTMVKFVPGFAAPVFVLYLIQRKRPIRELGLFLGAYVGACIAMAAPYLQGLLYVVGFQGSRPGTGLHWEMILNMSDILPAGIDWQAVNAAVSSYSLVLLIIGMLIAYRYVFFHEMSLNRMVLVSLFAYLLFTKIVNEQYALVLVPLSLVELNTVRERWLGWRSWRTIHLLLWLMPLIFAAFNVPLDRFLLPLFHTVFGPNALLITFDGSTTFKNPYIPWYHEGVRAVTLDGLAVGFMVLMVWTWIRLGQRAAGDTVSDTRLNPIFAAALRLSRVLGALGWAALATVTSGPLVRHARRKGQGSAQAPRNRGPSGFPGSGIDEDGGTKVSDTAPAVARST